MRPVTARLLFWTADLDDDLADPGQVRVFVPSIMGAGILTSIGILVGDALGKVLPNAGKAYRLLQVHRRAAGLVAPLATALGLPPPSIPMVRRRLRNRRFYGLLALVSATFSVYVAIGSRANYLRSTGPLSGVVWMEVLAVLTAVAALAVALASGAIAVSYPAAPRWLRWAIQRTPLGVLEE